MKKTIQLFVGIVLAVVLVLSQVSTAASETQTQANNSMKKQLQLANDITQETIVGPGSITVKTGKDLLMSFGAMIRMIPTSETKWDFGMSDKTDGFLLGSLSKNFYRTHVNEAGWIQDNYIRSEDRLYFNAMPRNRAWSFYAALEYDAALETTSVDNRGGKTRDTNNFGLERLHGTMALPWTMRLHAGWDVWHLDAMDGASMVYGDDNPGFWLTGGRRSLKFNVGYFKLKENNYQTSIGTMPNGSDDDRDLYAGHLIWKPDEHNKIKAFYAFDRIRSVRANDFLSALSGGTFGITGDIPDTNSHHAGAYWVGTFGDLELFTEGVYQFGKAKNTGLAHDDYDISAYALAADVSYEFKGHLTGFPLKPHLGIMYTSGDDNGSDDDLNGYTGVESAQRFSNRWGGENTIIGDTNFAMGTILYGYIPEFYGNGTPVFTGGLENTAGLGMGRGDNPGMTMISAGLTVAPKRFLIYKTNVNMFYWNEDFNVTNMVNPLLGTTKVNSGYAATEWDNEITLALSKNTFIKGQAAFLFPGKRVKDVTEALGAKADDTAIRVAAEVIWNF